jgi:hypothetical protein
MGLFSKILGKLGIGKKEEEKATAGAVVGTPAKPAAPAAKPAPAKPAATAAPAKPAPSPAASKPPSYGPPQTAAPKPAAVTPMAEVDVVAKLEALSKGKGLNWKVSIVDLLKLLDLDSSREARNELAEELGCPQELKSDSAKMNVWLHKTVLKKIAENGGNIPKELLD